MYKLTSASDRSTPPMFLDRQKKDGIVKVIDVQ